MDEKIREIKKTAKHKWLGYLIAQGEGTTFIMDGYEVIDALQILLSKIKELEGREK